MCSIACLCRNVQGGITGLAPMKTGTVISDVLPVTTLMRLVRKKIATSISSLLVSTSSS
jgi:hypothetical protein